MLGQVLHFLDKKVMRLTELIKPMLYGSSSTGGDMYRAGQKKQ